jgi:hypothetical protein
MLHAGLHSCTPGNKCTHSSRLHSPSSLNASSDVTSLHCAPQGEYKPQYKIAPEWHEVHPLTLNTSDYVLLAKGKAVHELQRIKGREPDHVMGQLRFKRGPQGESAGLAELLAASEAQHAHDDRQHHQ